MFSACGEKAEAPVNVKAENETTASAVQTPEDVSSDNGQMTAEVYIFDINEDRDTFFCTVYAAAEDSFGHASRDTEVEMNVSCLDSDNCYCYNGDATGGSFIATVYWPTSKCYFKLTCGNANVYEYTCYPYT